MTRCLIVASSVAIGACAPAGKSVDEWRAVDTARLPSASPPRPAGPIAATVNGEPITWQELAPALSELAGAAVLRDVVLDRAVRAACRDRGLRLDEPLIQAEERQLLDSIGRDTAIGAETPGSRGADSGVLLESIRRSRGLGEVRYRALLERNAMLRALVRDSVQVTGSEVEQAMLIRYGERFRVRVIVAATEREAVQARRELERIAGEGGALDVAFARAAALESIDGSAARGGLLEPISPADPAYPASLRDLLPHLQPNMISPVVPVERGFAFVLLDSKVPATIPPENAAELVRADVRLRKERLAMEAEARRLLSQMRVEPMDASLEWSWRTFPPP